MPTLEERLDTILPLVSKPGRYLGNEFHVIRKNPTREMVQWCLILPEVYEIGMSHWGLKVLYDLLNQRPDASAERSYSPWFDMEAQMRRHDIPLYALESKRPMTEFDFVGFSLQYELTYTNILQCLDLAGIALQSRERREADPIIIAGGPVVSNPEPLSDFIDVFLIGDGEEMMHRIVERYKELRELPRFDRLRELAKLPGLYVPQMYKQTYDVNGKLEGTFPIYDDIPKRVQRQFVIDLENAPVPDKPIVPLQGIVQDRLSIEVLRGCTQGCRFCQAGYLYRPIRERSVEKILEIADKGIRESGWNEIGLTSLSTADYTQLEPLADVLNARFSSERVGLSLPSLRADSFGVELADKVKETKKTGFTFAPEVGSERLRLAVNKLIRDQEFFDAAEIAYSRGWKLIKMYFMIGLPTEQWEDVDGIVNFITSVRKIGQKHSRRNSVNASVGSFIPKSHTPFQWDAFEPVDLLNDKIHYIRRKCNFPGSRVKWHDVETSHLEAVFSKGDRRLGASIEWAFRRGARFDGWTEHFDYKLWMQAFEETGVDVAYHTGKREFTDPLPWDHIDIRVSKKWLERERIKTDEAVLEVGKSLVTDCRHGDCTACGIPGLPYDTQLTPTLETEEVDDLVSKATKGAPRREDSGFSWPMRIEFEKVGNARFVSHLEMGTVLARAFRIARIPVAHSRGFVPRPRISFGPSLPVGIETTAEMFDAELLRPWSDTYLEALNQVLPEGLRILGASEIRPTPGKKRLSLSAIAIRARYQIDLSRLSDEQRHEVRLAVDDFANREDDCVVERTCWSPQSSREVTDWESPMDPLRAEPIVNADSSASEESSELKETIRSTNGAAAKPRHGKAPKPARSVNLRKAVYSLRTEEAGLEIELFLARPDGQVCNPKVILERLFLLSPEDQARVRIVRTALIDSEGDRLRTVSADLGEAIRVAEVVRLS